ncbi:MAG: hypothetical protein GY953_36215, partial [bacterium]|nr:hypothetical protein [bacterium]
MKSLPTLLLLATAAWPAEVDYVREIAPLLESRCYACHGSQQQMSGLRLDRRAEALRGGYSGTVIIPGNSASSRLIKLVAGEEEGLVMPPAGGKLSASEIDRLRSWIDQGAPWVADEP